MRRSSHEALVDNRYRLGRLVYQTKSALIFEATHRNGASAWLKLPSAAEHAGGLLREAQIANTTRTALIVRDDGVDADGAPYLVLDPLEDAQPLDLLLDGRGTFALERAVAGVAGDMLVGSLLALHEAGHAVRDVVAIEVLVRPTGDIALLGLDRTAAASLEAKRMNVEEILEILDGLLAIVTASDPADASAVAETRAELDAFRARRIADLGAVRETWRALFPQASRLVEERESTRNLQVTAPIADLATFATPMNPMTPVGVPALGSTRLATPETPLAVALPPAESSIIAYLASTESIEPVAVTMGSTAKNLPKPEMANPLENVRELPRLVRETVRTRPRETRFPWAAALAVAGLAVAAGAAAIVVLAPHGLARHPHPTAAVASPPAATETAAAPVAAAPAPPPVAPAAADDLELDDAPPPAAKAAAAAAAPSPDGAGGANDPTKGKLRTEGPADGRRFFLDGKLAGEGSLDIEVACGRHTLQPGTKGSGYPIEIPCGGERVIVFDRAGRWSLR